VSKIWSSDKNTNELEYGWLYICVYFDFLYGTLRVLFSIDVHIDRLKTFIYFLFLFLFLFMASFSQWPHGWGVCHACSTTIY